MELVMFAAFLSKLLLVLVAVSASATLAGMAVARLARVRSR
jgi:hypothetical protein